MEQAREDAPEPLTPARGAPRARRVRAPHRPAQEGDRGRDPPPARGRPRRRGHGQDAAQAAARGRRLHARLAARRWPALRKAIYPLTRKLAVRLARKRRHGRKGPLDFRNTVRHSLSATAACRPSRSSVPAARQARDLRRRRHLRLGGRRSPASRCTSSTPSRSQFSKVRSFVFIDGIDEVTRFFEGVEDITEAVHRVNTEADVVWVDGHSDYGHAFEVFWEKWGKEIGPKTTVIILGDARNNYHAVAGLGAQGDRSSRPATSTGSTPSPAPTGTPATRSSASTPPTATASSSAATSASSRSSSTPAGLARALPKQSLRRRASLVLAQGTGRVAVTPGEDAAPSLAADSLRRRASCQGPATTAWTPMRETGRGSGGPGSDDWPGGRSC